MSWGIFRQNAGLSHRVICAAMLAATAMPATAQPASNSQVNISISDARKIGPKSVRFSAAQLSRHAPTVILFGATTPSWHKARAAMQEAVAQGYQINCVFMGPTSEPPSLEIYAKGHHVTNPIDLNEISGPEITRLVRDVWREYYAG